MSPFYCCFALVSFVHLFSCVAFDRNERIQCTHYRHCIFPTFFLFLFLIFLVCDRNTRQRMFFALLTHTRAKTFCIVSFYMFLFVVSSFLSLTHSKCHNENVIAHCRIVRMKTKTINSLFLSIFHTNSSFIFSLIFNNLPVTCFTNF